MDHGHDQHNTKRRRLDERIQQCVGQTIEHSPMSISSLVDQRIHHRHILRSTEHSTSYSPTFQTHQPTRNSTRSTTSSAPFKLLEQSSTQAAQPFEARCTAPARHFRPWETCDSYNLSPAPDSTTSFAQWNTHNAPTLSSQAQVLDLNPAPTSYTTMPSPHPDLSSEDDDFEDEAQNPNAFTASQVNTEQSAMVCFGMVSWPV